LIVRAIGVGSAVTNHDTRTAVGDIDAGKCRETGIVIGDSVTTANRIKKLGAGVRPRSASALAVAVADGLPAVLPIWTVGVCRAGFRLALTAMANADAASGGLAGVAVGVSVAAANRVEDIGAGIRPRCADPFTIAVAFTLGAIEIAGTVGVSRAAFVSALATMVDGDTGGSRFAGISVSTSVTAAHRGEDVRANIRPRAADAGAIAVTFRFGTIKTTRTILVSLAPPCFTPSAMGDAHAALRGDARIAVRLSIATADRIEDIRTHGRLLAADTAALTIAILFSTIEIIRAIIVGSAEIRSALPGMGDIDAGLRGEAGVLVGHTVTAAHRILDERAKHQRR